MYGPIDVRVDEFLQGSGTEVEKTKTFWERDLMKEIPEWYFNQLCIIQLLLFPFALVWVCLVVAVFIIAGIFACFGGLLYYGLYKFPKSWFVS